MSQVCPHLSRAKDWVFQKGSMNLRGKLTWDNLEKSHPWGMPGATYAPKRGVERRSAEMELGATGTARWQATGISHLWRTQVSRERTSKHSQTDIRRETSNVAAESSALDHNCATLSPFTPNPRAMKRQQLASEEVVSGPAVLPHFSLVSKASDRFKLEEGITSDHLSIHSMHDNSGLEWHNYAMEQGFLMSNQGIFVRFQDLIRALSPNPGWKNNFFPSAFT